MYLYVLLAYLLVIILTKFYKIFDRNFLLNFRNFQTLEPLLCYPVANNTGGVGRVCRSYCANGEVCSKELRVEYWVMNGG